MHNNLTTPRHAVEEILGCNLADAIGIPEKREAERRIEQFLHAIAVRDNERTLAQWLDPQWVILAGGQGTRIDPSGRLNKTLDLWFGEHNTLQMSRRCLPGARPHIIVVNPKMAERLVRSDTPLDGIIPSSALNVEAVNRLCGSDVVLCVQPEQNGTGGALQAAIPAVQESDAEWIGIAFGDEPFLDRSDLSANTRISFHQRRGGYALRQNPRNCRRQGRTVFRRGRQVCRHDRVERNDG